MDSPVDVLHPAITVHASCYLLAEVVNTGREAAYELALKRVERLFGRRPPEDWAEAWRAEYRSELEREACARRLAHDYGRRDPKRLPALASKIRAILLQVAGADPYSRLSWRDRLRRTRRLSPTERALHDHLRDSPTMPFRLNDLKDDLDRGAPPNTTALLPFIASRFWSLPMEAEDGLIRFRHLSDGELAALCVVIDKNDLPADQASSASTLLADLRRRVARTRRTLKLPKPEQRVGRPSLPYP